MPVIPTQIFSWIDIPLVILLIFLEILLSADNAAAMALIAGKLPKEEKSKALFLGLATSVILRIVGILLAAYLIKFFWVNDNNSCIVRCISIKKAVLNLLIKS